MVEEKRERGKERMGCIEEGGWKERGDGRKEGIREGEDEGKEGMEERRDG